MSLAQLVAVLALLPVLHFTAPAFDARPYSCAAGPDSLRDGARFLVSRQRQSPTWLAHRDAMLADASAWSQWWPAVRREASPESVASLPFVAGAVGIVIPDSSHGWWYLVQTVDRAGNRSCESNLARW